MSIYPVNMKINFFIILLIFIQFSLYPEIKWHSYSDSFANPENKPFFLYFYSHNCAYCRKIEKQIFPSKEFKEWIQKFVFIKVNTDQEFEVLEKFQILGSPSMVILDANHVEIGRIDGFLPRDEFINRMELIYQNKDWEKNLLTKIKNEPDNFINYFRLGLYYGKAHQFLKAEEYFKKSLFYLKSSDAYYYENKKNILFNLSIINQRNNNYNKAYSYWNALSAWLKVNDEDYYFVRYYKIYSFLKMRSIENLKLTEKQMILKELQEIIEKLPNTKEKSEAKKLLFRLKL